MSTEQKYPDTSTQHQAVTGTSDALAKGQAEERADIEEDRRRQRALDDAEMGGEA